jgi:hypothetical protein
MSNRIASRFSGAPLLLLRAAPLLFPAIVSATCGLQFCPRPASMDAAAWEAGLRTRLVTFASGGGSAGGADASGSYAVVAPRALWRPGLFARALTFSAEVPLTRLQTGGESRTGLSNPLLAAVYGRRLSHAWSGEAGLQLELPLGDAAHGLADDHVMALPWIGLGRELGSTGSWRASGMAGYSQALEPRGHGEEEGVLVKVAQVTHNGEDHGAAPVLVNPHGDREIHWRAGLARILGRSTVEGFALGQTDLSDGARQYVRAGLGWDHALGGGLGLRLTADAPVSAARRAEMELGVGITMAQ